MPRPQLPEDKQLPGPETVREGDGGFGGAIPESAKAEKKAKAEEAAKAAAGDDGG